ncbi:MAG: hypothetical protein HUU50_22430, partial [Candidatus Brocadiae bacterium]|nr:hypothetical protein [Candidatus Brocadiia bacterium]
MGLSEAKEWVYKQTGFKFWLPDNWKTNWSQERSCFSGWDEKGKMEFDFFAPTKIRNLNTAAQYLIDEIDDWWISDIQLGNVHKGNINGLSCLYVEGKGISKRQSYAGWEEGAQIAFIAAIYQKDTQVLMMVGYAPDEKEEVSKNEIVEDDNEEDDNEED